jgi:hypothetical protein
MKVTINESWSDKYVRVKTKYIDECIEQGKEVCYVRYGVTQAYITDPKNTIFLVEADIYGIDLHKKFAKDSWGKLDPKPTHQLIIKKVEGGEIIFKQVLWDAEMFEVVIPVTTTTTEWSSLSRTAEQ